MWIGNAAQERFEDMEGRLVRHVDQLKEKPDGEEWKSSTCLPESQWWSPWARHFICISSSGEALWETVVHVGSSQAITLAVFTCSTLLSVKFKPLLNTRMANRKRFSHIRITLAFCVFIWNLKNPPQSKKDSSFIHWNKLQHCAAVKTQFPFSSNNMLEPEI